MEWNGGIMRKKLFSSFIVFALVLSLTFSTTSKAYAMGGFGEIILGTGAVIAVEEAIAWTLLACGLTAGADAVYRNQDELKEWANARLEDIKKFGNDAIEFGSDVVAGLDDWFTGVANGIMDTGSKCWDMVKSFAGGIWSKLSSPDLPFGGANIEGGRILEQGIFREVSGGWNPSYSYTATTAVRGDGKFVTRVRNKTREVISDKPFDWIITTTYLTGSKAGKTEIDTMRINVGSDGCAFVSSTLTDLVNEGNIDTPMKEQLFGDAGAIAGDYTTVGGVNDAYDKQQTLTDYDLLNKVGAGTHVGAGMIGLEWQQLMDKDKIEVDSNTGVVSGSIAGSLAGVCAGEMSWADSLDKVGVVPIIGSNVIDDAGVTDKPRPQKPNNPEMDGNYIFDLRHIFPFCLPFDLVDFLACLSAPPETPKFTIEIPSFNSDMSIKWNKLELDFSQFNQVAVWVRNMELFAFIVGLAMITRSKIIRG